jgi:hypothetical protein
MAFPGTYNFSYYRGDTLEFRVYPKNASGNSFSLTGFSAVFTVATSRGSSPTTSIPCFSQIYVNEGYVLCAIEPDVGSSLIAGTSYVYDIEINNYNINNPYDKVYTLLTGNIAVTDQVSVAADSGGS